MLIGYTGKNILASIPKPLLLDVTQHFFVFGVPVPPSNAQTT